MLGGNEEYEVPGTVLVYKLGGDEVLTFQERANMEIPEQPQIEASEEAILAGNDLYHTHCSNCHRGIGVTSIVATATPDLRAMTSETHATYGDIVLGGSRRERGMPSFTGTLDNLEIESIRVFLITEANKIRAWQEERRREQEADEQEPARG